MPRLRKGCSKELLNAAKRTIETYRMLAPGDSVLVGVSGGPDSVALLYILNELTEPYSLKLGVAHLNHALRQKESDDDAAFVAALSEKLALPCYIQKYSVSDYQRRHRLSTEDAARKLRYAFYTDVARKHRYNKIALGHQLDDNVELVLMFLFRGSGPLGISGIPPVRNENIIRPLIETSRLQVLNFLAANGLEYVCDSSNRDSRFMRNKLRNELIPLLKKNYNPLIVKSINRASIILRSENEWMEAVLKPIFEKVVLDTADNAIILSVPKLNSVHIAAVRRVIRRAITAIKGDLRRISFKHIDAIVNMAQSGPCHGRLNLPDRICIKRESERLLFSKSGLRDRTRGVKSPQKRHEPDDYKYDVHKPGMLFVRESAIQLEFSEIKLKELAPSSLSGHSVAFFDMDKLYFPLTVRNFRPGDRFTPLGMTGTQKVKKFFIDHKVPREERARCPILLSRGDIIWIVNHRIADSVKITPSTQRVLKVRRILA